jgi:hypothetical protein
MYYSISSNDKKFAFFTNYLNNIISGNLQYIDIVRPIISDAHELASGTKDFYTIDRYGFPLIVYLVEKEKDFFRTIDAGNLNTNDFIHILEITKTGTNKI